MVKIENSLFDAALRLVGTYVRMVPHDGEARQRLAELMAARSRDLTIHMAFNETESCWEAPPLLSHGAA